MYQDHIAIVTSGLSPELNEVANACPVPSACSVNVVAVDVQAACDAQNRSWHMPTL